MRKEKEGRMNEEDIEKQSYIEMDFNYGVVSKILMKDRKIRIQSKAVYTLLCTYAGSSRTAFPGVSLILADLGISRDTYYKYMNELKEAGYVKVTKVIGKGGKFHSNVYTLSPYPKSSYTEKSYTETSYTENLDTNSKSSKSKSIKSKSSKSIEKVFDENATRLANLLAVRTKANYDFTKITDTILKQWSADIEKIHRIDKYDWQLIEGVLEWSQKDDFWCQNVRSGKTLRKQFEKLLVKMKAQHDNQSNNVMVA